MSKQPKRKFYTEAEKAAYYKKKRAAAPQKVVYAKPRANYPKAIEERKPGILSSAGSAVGGGLGSSFGPLGTAVGSFLGGKLGHLVEKVTGFGDYKIDQNTIMQGGMTVPQIVNTQDKGGVIVRHREFVGDIKATTVFTVQSFMIQPGLTSSFPWLSQQANSYEQYRIRGMLFEFNSLSSDALLSTATSTALGSVIMMTDYDVADAPPSSKREMLNSEFASSAKPSMTFIHPIECKKSLSPQTMLYTRGAISPPADFDQRLYDFARFNIATEGMQAVGGVLGELWVTYEIEFYKPQFSFFGATDHFRATDNTAARPFGTLSGSNTKNGGTLGGSINSLATIYSFPTLVSSGKYIVVWSVVGAATANIVAPNLTVANGIFDAILVGDTLGWINAPEPAATNAQAIIMIQGIVRVTGQDCTLTLDNTGVYPPAAGCKMDWWVVRISDSIGANLF